MWYNKFISEVVLKNDTIPHSVGAFQRHVKKKKNPSWCGHYSTGDIVCHCLFGPPQYRSTFLFFHAQGKFANSQQISF